MIPRRQITLIELVTHTYDWRYDAGCAERHSANDGITGGWQNKKRIELLPNTRGLPLFVPEGQKDSSPAIYCWDCANQAS